MGMHLDTAVPIRLYVCLEILYGLFLNNHRLEFIETSKKVSALSRGSEHFNNMFLFSEFVQSIWPIRTLSA